MRAGIVASTVANVHRGKGRALTPKDFMIEFDKHHRRQSGEEMKSILNAFGAAKNAELERKHGKHR